MAGFIDKFYVDLNSKTRKKLKNLEVNCMEVLDESMLKQ